jgi:hypothetical protein
MSQTWRVWLGEGVERDFFSILRWTVEQFGKRQARVYETALRSALKALASGPSALGCLGLSDLLLKASPFQFVLIQMCFSIRCGSSYTSHY